ncbi:hypothetical protein CLU79DRAFT_764855 [Phycomyces nitens]|nr:hypothetical protein CLU79DRAFT_764855 [Phycomyces nitens]
MALSRLFSTKRKPSKDVSGRPRTKSTTADPSGILSRPFPPLSSRAKSPSDVLDFVGYPRLSKSTPTQRQQSPQQLQRCFTIRNQTPPPTDQTQFLKQTPIPPLKMPTPRRVIPPTRHMLSAELTDKTLVEEPESIYSKKDGQRSLLTAPFDPNVVINPRLSTDIYTHNNMSIRPRSHDNLVENPIWCPENGMRKNDLQEEITALQERIHEFNREKSEWAKRETEHRQNEQRMLETIHNTQVQLEKLSLATLNSQTPESPWHPRRRNPSIPISSSLPSLRRSRSHSTGSRNNSYTRDEESESSETNENSVYDDDYYDYGDDYNDSYEEFSCDDDPHYMYYPVAPSHRTSQSIPWKPYNGRYASGRTPNSGDTRGWWPKDGGRHVFQSVYDVDLDDYEHEGSGVPWSSSCPQPSGRGHTRYPRHPTPRVYNETCSFGQRYSTDPCRTASSSYRSQPMDSTVRRSVSSSSGSQRAPQSPHDRAHWVRRL